MRIEPSGIVMIGECEIQTPHCTALTSAPITAVWGSPGRRQIDVCRGCLEEMVRLGEWENPGARIPRRYDIAVYDKKERLQLVVEVKKHPSGLVSRTGDWATRIRRNLLVHSGIPSSVYFMLAVFPAPFYIWGQEDAPDAPASYTMNWQVQSPGINEYFENEYQAQEAVSLWLDAIVNSTLVREDSNKGQDWLFQSGLYQAIQGGRVAKQVEANVGERRVLQAV